MFRAITAGLRSLFRRQVVEQEVADELNHYFDLAVAENVRNGMTRESAERTARIRVGGSATREQVRAGGWESHVEFLIQDLRYALRVLRRNPAFAAIVIVTLALGIGANTAMFSVVNAVLLRPLPYRDASELTLIWTSDARRGLPREATAYATVMDWKGANRSFRDIGYYSTQRVAPMSNDLGGSRGRSRSAFVSPNLFAILGTAPAVGRPILPVDDSTRAPVAVISHAFWQRWFAGAPDILGRTFKLELQAKDGPTTLTVVGVMPPDFYFPDQATEIWTPATTYWRFQRESAERTPSWARRWTGIARLRDGVSVADARDDLVRIGGRLAAVHATTDDDFPGFGTTVLPIIDSIAGADLQSALWTLLGAVTLVLLVACLNVANLMLARGASRQQEIAVRRALGASRGRVARQLVVESLLLAAAGGVIGATIAAWSTRILAATAGTYVPRANEIVMDLRVLAFAALASIAAGLVFGVGPALRLSAASASESMREGTRGTGGAQLRRSRNALVMAECALAIVLLTGAGLLLRSLARLNAVSPGFNPVGVLTARVEFPPEAPPSAEERTQTSRIAPVRARAREAVGHDLLERLAALPGVEATGFSDDLFIAGQGNESITLPGRPADQIPAGELAEGLSSPGFFPVMRVPLRSGRYLTRDDAQQKIRATWSLVNTDMSLADKERLATPEPVVVNEAFVHRFFPGEDPVGRRFCIDPTNKTYWYEIVGVVGDMHRQGLDKTAIPQWFGPYIPSPNGRADVLVRVSGDPMQLVASVRREIARAVPGITIVTISTADSQLDAFSAQRRFQTWLLVAFAALALVLAAVGIFGLVHYAVAERTREIGVRLALGATPSDVLRLVLGQGMRMPAIGIAIGLATSAGLTRVMSHLLFNTGATDPVTFIAVALVLTMVAASACYIAARRAVRVDPILALRSS